MDDQEAQITLDRAWLVHFCARKTGDREVAEDLAQETLLVAWRNADRLYSPEVRVGWLAGIARRMCLNWERRRGRERSRLLRPNTECDRPDFEDWPDDDVDLEHTIERHEIAETLDSALAALPLDTRSALLAHYCDGVPQREIAARLDLSLDAVEARLRRGRVALRRMLAADLHLDTAADSAVLHATGNWQETRIWCPSCGRRKLLGRFDRGSSPGLFQLRCADCHPDPRFMHSHLQDSRGLLDGVRMFKPALNRVADWVSTSYTQIQRDRSLACPTCGQRNPLRPEISETLPSRIWGLRGLHVRCDACDAVIWENTLSGLLLSLPAARHFWHEHPRLRTLPEREVEAQGGPALVTTFESVTESARLEIVSSADTLRVLKMHEATRG